MKIDDVVEENGYYIKLKLQDIELLEIRNIIEKHYWNINKTYSLGIKEEIRNYHKDKLTFDHGSFWSQDKRSLKDEDVFKMRKMPFFQELLSNFGNFDVGYKTGEKTGAYYFRICRPNKKEDIGPMHADYWFWELGHGEIPEGKKRVKVWIALWSENGLNGLRYVPNSHKKKFPYKSIKKDGFIYPKPQIITKEESLDIHLFDCEPGSVIIFHDRLLHGGAPNKGLNTRISLEFTMLVDIISQ